VISKVGIASASISNGGFSSFGQKKESTRFELRIITELRNYGMILLKRKPTSPGEILREEFLLPLNITQRQLADHIGCDLKVINRVVNQRTQLTPKIAMKLAAAFNTTPDFWLNAQRACDLYKASFELKSLPQPLIKKAG